MTRNARRAFAAGYGLLTHTLFVAAVGAMVINLHEGMRWCLGAAHGLFAIGWNTLLALQFPVVHSLLLSRPGRVVLARFAPRPLGADLATTTFAMLASIQIGLTFTLWSPSGTVWWEPHGVAGLATCNLAYVASWAFLVKALYDAGLALQTGSLGWMAVFRGRRPDFGSFPTGGLFRRCRQPVYLGFAATLWTGPVWTPDRLALAVVWTAYCVVGPRFKETRYRQWYGDAFRRYQSEVPYMTPRLGPVP